MLNLNQKRYIVSRLATLERELVEILDAIRPGENTALFPRYRNPMSLGDLTALKQRLEGLRAAMRRFLDAHGIAHSTSGEVEARWALQTHLAMLENSIIELRPRYVQGYGALDEEGARICQSLAAELGLLLEGMEEVVRPHAVPPETQSISTDVWAKLISEIIERYRLTEYRPRLNDLIANRDTGQIELAVLGRVSSGKSSLINALIGQPLLPVGAIPVTAVTTRLRYGPELAVETLDLDGRLMARRSEELAMLISEAGNQDNRLRLAEIRVRVPAPLLKEGITLTDTPGLGSLSPSASMHALDYLPRCELGIVTLDSTATLAPADVDLVRGLQEAGADVLAVLTKCDLLEDQSRKDQQGYVAKRLAERLQRPVNIAAISTHPEWEVTLKTWITDTLMVCVRDSRKDAEHRHALRRQQLAHRLKLILEQAREERVRQPAAGEFAETSLALQQTDAQINALIDTIRTRAVKDAGETALADWRRSRASRRLDEVFSDALAAQIDAKARKCLKRAEQASAQLAQHGESKGHVPALPTFVSGPLTPIDLARWYAGPWPGAGIIVRSRLRSLEHLATNTVLDYAERLRAWARVTLNQMRNTLRSSVASTVATADPEQLTEDIRRLETAVSANVESSTPMHRQD